jgi:mono/diheme cytochrome c family protein
MKTHHLAVALAVAAGLFACNKTESKPQGGGDKATANTTGSATVESKSPMDVYDSRCSVCHGTTGEGDGPGAAALNPKPRNYKDKAWQKSVTDEQIKKAIVQGGAAVGKSPTMPANPDLAGKPEVVDGLVKVVRGFGG